MEEIVKKQLINSLDAAREYLDNIDHQIVKSKNRILKGLYHPDDLTPLIGCGDTFNAKIVQSIILICELKHISGTIIT